MGIHWTKTKAHTSVVLITYMHHGIMYVSALSVSVAGLTPDSIYNSCDWSRIQSIPLSDM